MLFYAILYSESVGPHLAPTVRKNVNDLRNFRNAQFAHITQGRLSDTDFQNAIGKVDVAFQALSLTTEKIQGIKNQATFLTEQLLNTLKNLQEKENQRQVLADQLYKEVPSFCILPPEPAHDIGSRDREVAKIAQQLKELKKANYNRLSYSYISGNPGSGKSQLAGLVAERFFHEQVKEMPDASSFVMTLNAASPDSLLESYTNFARQLKCPDYSVMQILSSKEWSIDNKIANLKTLVGAKISNYASWLIVVDNVTTLSSVHVYLPQSGNEAWARGQLLITTQDTTSIPLESSLVNHISVSKGMEPDDASCLLAKLSGIADGELGLEVARKLDYQPLALAGAAVFVKSIREDKIKRRFGWDEYLKLLEKGKRERTEHTLADKNSAYPNTMTKAITLAVETQVKSDKFVKDLFSLLSICAPQPLNVNVAINYIVKANEHFDEEDKDLIHMTFRGCSLLLLEEQKDDTFIRVHQVVHDAIKLVMSGYQGSQTSEIVSAAVASFNQFIVEIPPENTRLDTMNIIPHIDSLHIVIDQCLSTERLFQVQGIAEKFKNLGEICRIHREFVIGKRCLAIQQRLLGVNHVDVAASYTALSAIYKDLWDLEKAKECQQKALEIQIEKLGGEHVTVAKSYSNLAVIFMKLDDLAQAEEYQQRARAIEIKKYGMEHVSSSTSYDFLALIQKQLGNLKQATEYQRHALSIKFKILGAGHVSVAKSYCNLGLIHKDLGDLERAMEYQQRALDIKLKKFGAENVSVATSYSNFALIYMDLGDFAQAKEYKKRALSIELKQLGAEHISVAESYNNFSVIHNRLHDLNQAEKYQKRAVEIKLKKLGPEHVSVATSYSNLSSIYKDFGDFEQAEVYQQRALAIKLKKLGAEHDSVATSYSHLASIHQGLGDFEQFKKYHQLALAIKLEKL